MRNLFMLITSKLVNHIVAFPQWLNFSFSTSSLLTFSTKFCWYFSICFYNGFSNRHEGFAWKLSLWSLKMMKARFSARHSTLLLILSLAEILLASRMEGKCRKVNSLYKCVIKHQTCQKKLSWCSRGRVESPFLQTQKVL